MIRTLYIDLDLGPRGLFLMRELRLQRLNRHAHR